MNLTPEIITAIDNSFQKKAPGTVKTRPCRILFNGRYITTKSNKTIWRNIGFAKTALLNHLESNIGLCVLVGGGDRYKGHYAMKELRVELEKAGIVQYVETDMEGFAIQKR